MSAPTATIDRSNDVCNQHELGQTNAAPLGQTMFASSVFPECQQSAQPLTGQTAFATSMSLVKQTPQASIKRCLQALSFQSVRVLTQHWSSVFPECRQASHPFIGQPTFATSMSLVQPTSQPWVKRCLQALSFQSVDNHRSR